MQPVPSRFNSVEQTHSFPSKSSASGSVHRHSQLPRQPRLGRRAKPHSSRPFLGITVEVTAKLVVNILLSAVAISVLARILPYQISQQEKLQEIRTEVQRSEARVNQLRADLNRYFDPQQTQNVLQESQYRIAPQKKQVIWLNER